MPCATHSVILHIFFRRSQILLEFSRHRVMYCVFCIVPLEAATRDVPRRRCSENMQQIYRRTSMPNRDFKKVVLQLYSNHTWE